MARRMAGWMPLEFLGKSPTRLRAERFVREFLGWGGDWPSFPVKAEPGVIRFPVGVVQVQASGGIAEAFQAMRKRVYQL